MPAFPENMLKITDLERVCGAAQTERALSGHLELQDLPAALD